MIAPDFVLSAREFDILWDGLGLGPKPYPLDVPSVGRTSRNAPRRPSRCTGTSPNAAS